MRFPLQGATIGRDPRKRPEIPAEKEQDVKEKTAILCCGEALIDMLPATTADGRAAFLPACGGSVFNTAVALGHLGSRVLFFGGLSDDMFGRMLRKRLSRAGVDSALAPTSARPTTLAFVKLTEGEAGYAFFDENTAGRMLAPGDLPPVLPESVQTLFFGGISLALEPCAESLETLLLREAGHRLIMLDPNIRPAVIADAARYRARLERLMRQCDILKLSDDDLAWWSGRGDPAEQARAMLDMGPRAVFLTQGARGARLFTRHGTLFRPAPKMRVVDTVGAGDAFNAGVLHGLGRAGALGKSALARDPESVLCPALEPGIAVAATTVTRAGAEPPRAEEITCAH